MERNESLRKSKSKDRANKSRIDEEEEPKKGTGLVRTKPSREIYRPPSVRKDGKPSNGDNHGKFQASSQNSSNRQMTSRQLNVHAKEFTFPAPVLPGGPHSFFGAATPGYYTAEAPLTPFNSRCFPLQQSKSSGNVQNYFHLWNQQQIQAQHQLQFQQQQAYYGLQQSKSSGNIIANGGQPSTPGKNGKIVRFDFSSTSSPSDELREHVKAAAEDGRMAKLQRELDMTKDTFASLNLNGQGNDRKDSEYSTGYPSPLPTSKFAHTKLHLQKSISSFSVPDNNKELPEEASVSKKFVTTIKRSNSFIPKSSIRNGSVTAAGSQTPHYLITNIELDVKRWPKEIQDAITASIIGEEKIPARRRIAMVSKILEIILLTSDENGNQEHTISQDAGSKTSLVEMVPSAVNIFLYFVQREKDRTVMETVVNTCFATSQKLQQLSAEKARDNPVDSGESPCCEQEKGHAILPKQWAMLLQLVSSLYTKVKVMRVQSHPHPGFKALDELKKSMMSLLCDSCLVTLQTAALQSSEIMDLLFTIMTSIGRDMETCHPTKMKQILAAVRDVLLGIKPYGGGDETASPGVQKTLMQLIELHAANWHLPASAVRYYYYQPM